VKTDDAALIERCRAGDIAAFEPLVEKYRQRVWRLAYNVLRDREEAWDVSQEAFVRAWQALPNFRGQSAFYTWLFRIAMNVASDRARARAARGRAFGTERIPEEDWDRVLVDQPVEATPDAAAAGAQKRARIERALATLSDDHRRIVVLSDIEGLTYKEIADVLEIPMGTVMSRLHNARKRLKPPSARSWSCSWRSWPWQRRWQPTRSRSCASAPVCCWRPISRRRRRRCASRHPRRTSGSRRSCRGCASSRATRSTRRSSVIARR